jgi:hypothetical protein
VPTPEQPVETSASPVTSRREGPVDGPSDEPDLKGRSSVRRGINRDQLSDAERRRDFRVNKTPRSLRLRGRLSYVGIFDLMALVVENLARRKGRVALTAVGVIIGTAAVVLLVSLASGLQQNAATSWAASAT